MKECTCYTHNTDEFGYTEVERCSLCKSAPDLYENLKNLVSRIDQGLALGQELDLKPAREALAEAEGNDEFDFQFGQRGEHPDGDEIDRNEEGI